jgi:hypothetical protein
MPQQRHYTRKVFGFQCLFLSILRNPLFIAGFMALFFGFCSNFTQIPLSFCEKHLFLRGLQNPFSAKKLPAGA